MVDAPEDRDVAYQPQVRLAGQAAIEPVYDVSTVGAFESVRYPAFGCVQKT